MLKEIFLRRLRLKRSEARVSEETLDWMTSVLPTDRAVGLHHNFTLLYFIYPFERRSGRALMLSISRESEGFDKGNIDVKDVAVTMGLLCALRLSLKPLTYIPGLKLTSSCFMRGHRLVLCACFASWLVSKLVITRTISFSVDMMLKRCQSYHFSELASSGLAGGPS